MHTLLILEQPFLSTLDFVGIGVNLIDIVANFVKVVGIRFVGVRIYTWKSLKVGFVLESPEFIQFCSFSIAPDLFTIGLIAIVVLDRVILSRLLDL